MRHRRPLARMFMAGMSAASLALATVRAEAGPISSDGVNGEVRASALDMTASTRGPIARANQLQPGLAPRPEDTGVLEVELRDILRTRVANLPTSLAINALGKHEHPRTQAARTSGRINELHASMDLGTVQASVGKKIVSWDVGYGFRPNDVVQQEARRQLLPVTQEGRPLLQLDRFGADSSLTVVWVNPQRTGKDALQGPDESALAARWYQHVGDADVHLIARLGDQTSASLGAAVAWIATDDWEIHASARALQRRQGWAFDQTVEPPARPVAQSPWHIETEGSASQWLLGTTWTGHRHQSFMLEYWHDGTAMSDTDWRAWFLRNQALDALPGHATVRAANLAWQAQPLVQSNLRQDNVFVRVAWQPEHWVISQDALLTPADRGRILTTSIQWQGDQWRFNGSWRVYQGPSDALFSQLPTRRVLLLATTLTF